MQIDPKNPYVVYFHSIDGILFYIGSGVLARAFDHGAARRNECWNRFCDERKVTVDVAHYCRERAEARRLEYGEIRKYRPIANLPFDPGMPFETALEYVGSWLVASDPWGGKLCVAHPSGRYSGLATLAQIEGLPKAEIARSVLTGEPAPNGQTYTRWIVSQYVEKLATQRNDV